MARLNKALMTASALAALGAAAAAAQAPAANPSDWTRPYGQGYGGETQPYAGAARGGNRVVINGIIQTGVGVSAQASAFGQAAAGVGTSLSAQNGIFASAGASAIGNQLNVVVNGNYNTVVVNSRQTNTGDITATAGAVAGQQTAGARDDGR